MTTFANTTVSAQKDGTTYASGVTLTTSEVDLFNGTGPGPVPVTFEQAVSAEVALTVSGGPASASTYVVLQTDFGDGNWFDVAWAVSTSVTNGTTFYLLSGGVAGANAFQQSRAVGTAPASTGSNQCALGGRIRFVGKSTLTGGASPAVTVTVVYKLLGMR